MKRAAYVILFLRGATTSTLIPNPSPSKGEGSRSFQMINFRSNLDGPAVLNAIRRTSVALVGLHLLATQRGLSITRINLTNYEKVIVLTASFSINSFSVDFS